MLHLQVDLRDCPGTSHPGFRSLTSSGPIFSHFWVRSHRSPPGRAARLRSAAGGVPWSIPDSLWPLAPASRRLLETDPGQGPLRRSVLRQDRAAAV